MRLTRFGTTPLAWWLKLGIDRQARHDGRSSTVTDVAPTSGGYGYPRCVPPTTAGTTGRGHDGGTGAATPATPPTR